MHIFKVRDRCIHYPLYQKSTLVNFVCNRLPLVNPEFLWHRQWIPGTCQWPDLLGKW